jgi:hypothetical protein
MAIDYQHIQKLKPRRSPSAVARTVSLGYDRFFRQSYPCFQELRTEHGRTDLPFQVGIPTGFAMGFAFASPLDWLRYTTAFNSVFAREVNAILREAGDDVLLQIELPPEVYAANLLPPPLHGLALWPLHDLLRKIRPGAQIGLHLCLGDFHNAALVHPKSLHRMVALSNRLVARWPRAHTLRYVHYPLAEGAVPPTLDVRYYAPLRDAVLPAGTRFVAGFVHEARSLEEHARILAAIEEARGQVVDVASSCGLGRRTPEAAMRVLECTRQVVALAGG